MIVKYWFFLLVNVCHVFYYDWYVWCACWGFTCVLLPWTLLWRHQLLCIQFCICRWWSYHWRRLKAEIIDKLLQFLEWCNIHKTFTNVAAVSLHQCKWTNVKAEIFGLNTTLTPARTLYLFFYLYWLGACSILPAGWRKPYQPCALFCPDLMYVKRPRPTYTFANCLCTWNGPGLHRHLPLVYVRAGSCYAAPWASHLGCVAAPWASHLGCARNPIGNTTGPVFGVAGPFLVSPQPCLVSRTRFSCRRTHFSGRVFRVGGRFSYQWTRYSCRRTYVSCCPRIFRFFFWCRRTVFGFVFRVAGPFLCRQSVAGPVFGVAGPFLVSPEPCFVSRTRFSCRRTHFSCRVFRVGGRFSYRWTRFSCRRTYVSCCPRIFRFVFWCRRTVFGVARTVFRVANAFFVSLDRLSAARTVSGVAGPVFGVARPFLVSPEPFLVSPTRFSYRRTHFSCRVFRAGGRFSYLCTRF